MDQRVLLALCLAASLISATVGAICLIRIEDLASHLWPYQGAPRPRRRGSLRGRGKLLRWPHKGH